MRLPEELLEEMDIISSIEDMDRTELTKKAVRDFIMKARRKAEFKEQVVDLYLNNKISFEKLEVILGQEDAFAIRASKEIMKQGEQLAKKLA